MKAPAPLATIGAPIGWHIKRGGHGKPLAHFWKGRDGRFHAFLMTKAEPAAVSITWGTKEEAARDLKEMIEPTQTKGVPSGK